MQYWTNLCAHSALLLLLFFFLQIHRICVLREGQYADHRIFFFWTLFDMINVGYFRGFPIFKSSEGSKTQSILKIPTNS